MAGKTFTNSSTVGATGTMPNHGAVTGSITTSGGSYTIPAGYHNGSGKVTGPTLAALVKNSNVSLNNASNLLSGVTAYGKDGVKYTGSMPNKGAVTGSITTSGGSYTIPAGYHNGSGKVTGPTLAALVGTSVTLTSNANLLTGYTAYGKNGVKYTGSMANKGAWTNTPTTKGKVTIPAGYHNGSGYVDTTSVYNKGMSDADTRVNTNSASYKEAAEDAVLNLFKANSSQVESLSGKTISAYIYNSLHGSWGEASDSYSYDSGLIPIIKTINGKKAVLISIQFTVSHENWKSSYGGEQSGSSSSYRLEWENGTEILSGTSCNNLYTNLLNYDLGSNTGIRLISSGYGNCMVGTNNDSAARFSAGISGITVTYKIFQ